MKPISIFLLLLSSLAFSAHAKATPADPATSTQQLKKEIAAILYKQDLQFLEQPVEKVTVEFLINAKNEIVVLHVEGESDNTCNKIKEILGHKEVKYQQPRQLVRYKVELRLVK